MMMAQMIIDSREHSDLTDKILLQAQEMNIQTEKKWLEIGDYVFGDICIEAKSSFDFMQSIHNKRLWNQLDNMDRAYPNNYLVLHGSFDQGFREFIGYTKGTNTRNMRTMMKRKYLASIGRILLDLDCTLIECKDSRQAAERICLMCKMQPHERAVYSPSMIRKKKISTEDLRIDVLSTIKGVSEKKAKILIENYGSIMEIGETLPTEIAGLDGFGMVLAERVHSTLNSEEKMVI
tara:strand:+ start:29 stop:733 length:705 start_codon:yes stop_codon:yes gene_type:complete